jgi:hypothetical protein
MQSSSIPITSHSSILPLGLSLSLSLWSLYHSPSSPVHTCTQPSSSNNAAICICWFAPRIPITPTTCQPHNPKFSSHQTIHSPLFPQGKPIFTTTLLSTASASFSDQIDHPNPPFLFSLCSISSPPSSSRCSSNPIYSALFGPKLSAVCSAKPNLYRPILLKIRRARLSVCPENASLMFFVPWNPIFAALF